MLAEKAIKQYVGTNYSFLDLETGKVSYNFKEGSYISIAKSRTSIDTKFSIYCRNGKVMSDDYEMNVLGMFNTAQRLSDEYSAVAKGIVRKELGYENTTMVTYDKSTYENAEKILKLDMKFDKALPLNAEVILRLDLTDNSIDSMAKVLTDAHKAFKANGCNFVKYELFSENGGTLVMINNVTPGDIESGNLTGLLNKAKSGESGNGISVLIK
ncbi:MAG: hypothetical protein ABRQ27_12695 [Clostridiaceae bacterium]